MTSLSLIVWKVNLNFMWRFVVSLSESQTFLDDNVCKILQEGPFCNNKLITYCKNKIFFYF